MMLNTLEILTLLQLPKFGPSAVREAILAMDDVADITSCDRLGALVAQLFPARYAFTKQTLDAAADEAQRIAAACDKLGVTIVTYADEHYPPRLRRIAQSPPVIYALGNWKALTERASLAVVGTRQPTSFGQQRAIWAGKTCARENLVVVSGLALGCDTFAHVGCVQGGGITVAVLAHGLDTVSPASNRALAREILDKNGALVSEYPPATRAFPQNFVHRDRLQIGLAAGLVVIETDIKGGTMHTVGFCRDQGKGLACIGHDREWLKFEKTRGNRMLIDQRIAYEICTDDDLVNFAHFALESEGNVGTNRKLFRE